MSRWYKPGTARAEAVKARTKAKRLANPEWYLWDKASRRAKNSGVPFTIKVSDVVIPERCPLLGIKISILAGKSVRPHSATIDRIIPEKGYVEGNIWVISQKANSIKTNATVEEIEKVAKGLRSIIKKAAR